MPAVRLMIDVDVGRAHALDDLAVEAQVARAAAGLGVAHVDVRDRGARLGRLDRRVGDRGRRDRHALGLARRVTCAGHRAGDEDLPVHCSPLRVACCAREPIRPPDAASSAGREHRAHSASTAAPRSSPAAAARPASASPARSSWPSSARASRSPRRPTASRQRAAELRAAGATVHAHVADLTDRGAGARARRRRRGGARPARRARQQRRARADRRRDRRTRTSPSCPSDDVPARPRAQPADRVPRHAGGAARHARARLRAHRHGLVGHRAARDDAGLGRATRRPRPRWTG